MARLLFDGRFFGARTRREILESQYENLLLTNASLLFPGFHMIKFKPNVRSGTRTKQPDFALIEHNYRTWWVVEVELSHHSFKNHVLPQVEVFRTGDYTDKRHRQATSTSDTNRIEVTVPRRFGHIGPSPHGA